MNRGAGFFLCLTTLVLAWGCASGPAGPPARSTEPAAPRLPPVSAELLRKIEVELVTIPAGSLAADFRSQHSIDSGVKDPAVPIASFQLAKHEVTQAEWVAVMGENPSEDQSDPNLPVANVSWPDTQSFLKRLNEAAGAPVFRLPTSPEWEYGCRAGSRGHVALQAREATLSKYAWWGKNSGGRSHPVATLKPNAWGLYDMLGNVAEWCQNEAEKLGDSRMFPIAGANFEDENLVGQDCSPGGSMGMDGKDAFTGFRVAKSIGSSRKRGKS